MEGKTWAYNLPSKNGGLTKPAEEVKLGGYSAYCFYSTEDDCVAVVIPVCDDKGKAYITTANSDLDELMDSLKGFVNSIATPRGFKPAKLSPDEVTVENLKNLWKQSNEQEETAENKICIDRKGGE